MSFSAGPKIVLKGPKGHRSKSKSVPMGQCYVVYELARKLKYGSKIGLFLLDWNTEEEGKSIIHLL